jgi:hypothetical protein
MSKLLDTITLAANTAAATTGVWIKLTSPPGAGSAYSKRTFQAYINTTTGSVTAGCTIAVQVSNDPRCESTNTTTQAAAAVMTLGSIVLAGTASTSVTLTDGFASDANWQYVRGYIAQSSLTGTATVVSLVMGD